MILAITLLKCLLLAKFISTFEPLQWILDTLKDNLLKYLLVVITSCFKCASFWVTLTYTQDIFIASAASYIAYLYHNAEQNLTTYLWQRKQK
jgi:hypothetical protein